MDWITQYLDRGGNLSLEWGGFALAMAGSVAAALLAEFMYDLFYEERATGSNLQKSFLLLGPSITFLFLCIQLSLPLSLGLLGALSIIRFRTPVKEPEEIGFLMILIAGSIGLATFSFAFVAGLYALTFVMLALKHGGFLKNRWIRRRAGTLLINAGEEDYRRGGTALDALLQGKFKGLRLESVSLTEGTVSLHYLFADAAREEWTEVHRAIQAAMPCRKISVYFSPESALV